MNGNGHEEFSTGNPAVDAALKRLNGKFKDLEDAMIIQAHLEKRQSENIKSHAEFIAEHEARLKEHETRREEHALWMKQIEEKLNALTMWLMKREGLPEAGDAPQ